jgi:outer membrane protein assembly factor BamB
MLSSSLINGRSRVTIGITTTKTKCLIVALVGLLIIQGCGVFAPLVTAEGLNSDGWSMFRHDLTHSGTATSGPTHYGKLLWAFEAGAALWSSPAVVDGRVFVGCRDGNLYCLNAFDGAQIWSYQTGGLIYYSSPAVADGKVYVGSDNCYLNCINASSGELIWRTLFGGPVRSSPAIVDGRLYVGCDDKNIYCLDAASGEKNWSYPTGKDVESSPVVVGGVVYCCSGDNYLYALNATTGTWLWWFFTEGAAFSSPCISNGCAYVGSYGGAIFGINASSGQQLWKYQTPDVVVSSPAVAYGYIYIGSEDNNLYCLNASTGQRIWQSPTGYWIWSSPAVADGCVYVGSDDFNIYCFDAFTGKQRWMYPTANAVDSSPALAYGNLYIGSCDNVMYAITDSPVPVVPIQPIVTSTFNIFLFDALSVVIAGVALFVVGLTIRNSMQPPLFTSSVLKGGWRERVLAHPDALCVLAVLGFSVLFFVNLGNGPLWGADEQTYSQWAYHMFRTGDYVTPWTAGGASLWVSKPPLAMWFMSLAYQMVGVSNFAVRFWSAVFGALCCVLVFYLGKKLYSRQVGILSAFVMGTFGVFFVFAQHAMTDVPLLFFILASIYCIVRMQEGKHANWFAALSGLAFGLALLTKQVEGLLIVMILFGYLVLTKKSVRFIFTKRAALFLAMAGAVFVPWVIVMDAQWHAVFWHEYFMYSAYSRSVVAIEGHTGGYLYYFEYLFAHDNLLWMVLLPFATALCVFNAFVKRHKADLLLLVWMVVVVGVFTFAQTKLYWYILPVIPAFALAISNLLYQLFQKAIKSEKARENLRKLRLI